MAVLAAILICLGSIYGHAVVSSIKGREDAENRIKEIDASLQDLNLKLKQSAVSEKNRKDLNALADNLQEERKLIIERELLFKRLEKQGLLIYFNPTPSPASEK